MNANSDIENSQMWKDLGFDTPNRPTNSPDNVIESQSFKQNEAHDLAKNSLDFLAALALPTVFRYFFPDMYQAAWKWLLDYIHRSRDFSQLALGLPRGFAKTTFVKIFLLYVILFTTRKFILICAENTPKAINILSDVMDMLNEPNIKAVFGDWKLGATTDQAAKKVFGFRGRTITFVAATVDTVRGLNLKNERPDVMIFDDIQSRKQAESQTESESIEREMIGTAMKAKSPHGCIFIFVGNMYPTKHSILRKLKSNPNWLKFIVGAINAKGESIWEELQPISQLMKELENDMASGHPEIFVSEVLNDENAQANNLIDLSALPAFPIAEGDIPAGNYIVIDPSGDKHNSDAVTIGYFEIHNALPILMEHEEARMSPLETIHRAIKMCMRRNCNVVAIEGTAYQSSLNYWFSFVCQQLNISGIQAVEVYPGSLSKHTRIAHMLLAYGRGELFIHPNSQPAVHLQITSYNPLKRDNTDGLLDVLTYGPAVLEMYGGLIQSMSPIGIQEFNAAKTIEFNSPF